MKLTLKTNITNSHITTFQYRKQNIGKKIAPPVYPSPISSFLSSSNLDRLKLLEAELSTVYALHKISC